MLCISIVAPKFNQGLVDAPVAATSSDVIVEIPSEEQATMVSEVLDLYDLCSIFFSFFSMFL